MSNELKIELLWNCAKSLKSENQTNKLLSSYYINTCRMLVKNNLRVPKEKFGLSQMCPHCGSFWHESEFELKSISKRLKLSTKEKNLIENYKNNNDSGKGLSRSQKNRAKWLMKKGFKRLAIKCQQCKHTFFLNMENEKNKSLPNPPRCEIDAILPQECKKYVQGASKKKVVQIESNLQPRPKKKGVMEKQKASTCSNNRMKPKMSSSNKVISNTQKQNSLLQLAALLRKQINVGTKNSSQNELQKLLK